MNSQANFIGLSDKVVSDKDIMNTIKISNLTNLMARLPNGIDQKISEKGSNLSEVKFKELV